MSGPGDPLTDRLSLLNSSQRTAVDAMLEGWDAGSGAFLLPVVEGPPGTGKTTVGVVGAAKYTAEDDSHTIAYVAYTNYAAARAQESFAQIGLQSPKVVRLTHELAEKNWDLGVVGCRSDLSDLTPEEQRRLKEARVLITTLHSSGRIFQAVKRPLIIVDEYSQVSPPAFFLLLSKVARTSGSTGYNPRGYVLLGDPNQLPVITSQPMLRPNIGNFLLSRKKDLDSHQLDVQYRMHQSICDAVNALRDALNTYPLKTHPDVTSRDLKALGYRFDPSAVRPPYDEVLGPRYPLVLIDTDSLPNEEYPGLNQSKCYNEEARLAAHLSTLLRKAYRGSDGQHLRPVTLSPYTGQVGLIIGHLKDRILKQDCLTVYKSQGREYPAVVVSFVRKNPQGNIGFLGEPELHAQTYVACSRAQGKLILLFSFETFKGNLDFGTLLDRCGGTALVVKGSDLWSDVT